MRKKDYQIIDSHFDNRLRRDIIITYITKDEEDKLDSGRTLIIKRGDKQFKITSKDYYCYGSIDFNTGSDDYNTLASFKLIKLRDGMRGFYIPSNYNYNTHSATSDRPKGRWYDTLKSEKVCQYLHGVLGKPEKTIIFKQIVKC